MKFSKNLFSLLALCFVFVFFSINTIEAQTGGEEEEEVQPIAYSKIKRTLRSSGIKNLEIFPGNKVRAITPPRRAGKSFTSDEKGSKGETHCAQVNCPPIFEKGITCWKCKEVKANTGNSEGQSTRPTRKKSSKRLKN